VVTFCGGALFAVYAIPNRWPGTLWATDPAGHLVADLGTYGVRYVFPGLRIGLGPFSGGPFELT
tara:strand:- start:205 stop:396 length:192 start_codon:yes stop_codon:yes gene_type:complete